jgi:phosphatidylinositol-3-phosphatase
MRALAVAAALVLTIAACSGSGRKPAPSSSAAAPRPTPASTVVLTSSAAGGTTSAAVISHIPRYAHIVVVVEENHASSQVLGSSSAPYINALARSGVVLTRSYGVTHPSQPNYLALFSGSTKGVTNDSCPHTFRGNNLGAQLRARGFSFAGYSQGLPATGSRVCSYHSYARKHAPWVNFSNLPGSVNRPMSSFPRDPRSLPTVSFVIPNLAYDMHDGTVRQADTWLHDRLAGYVTWARTHNSLLVLTWDEDDNTPSNHILGVLAGAHLSPGRYSTRVDHYTMLRTIEAAYGLPALGRAANRSPISGIWKR